jgi:hypothetical protein
VSRPVFVMPGRPGIEFVIGLDQGRVAPSSKLASLANLCSCIWSVNPGS